MEAIAAPLARFTRRVRQYFLAYPVKRKPANVYGLKYLPTIEPAYSDDSDFIFGLRKHVKHEITQQNLDKMREVFLSKRDTCKCVMEIGVHRNAEGSFTHIFLNNKRDETIYLGIDVEDKSFLDDRSRHIFTLQTDSSNQDLVRQRHRELGNHKIDVLLIDGWHSVNMMVNDWKYVDLLAGDGVVVVHDTNCHPGPVCVFDAVDERFFQKQKFFMKDADWGMAILQRIR